ncbi:prepilin peptidase [Thermomonospora umbrina]|uniref:Leader peptidase (Prepilin peptidase)/N-methyltransferase n=1 Tax=Thermomonospora umbrina TaxID=111806 RepID=A0A3D9SUM2_9ACTN|nr:A24 family peptidase [Thermomonospora umbrina]REE99662.1 leader peptidase (prepilin peptidase)/N-methyltransferase [Thermomonospora umbrina]
MDAPSVSSDDAAEARRATRDWLAPVARRPLPVTIAAAAVVALLAWRIGPRPDLAAFVLLGVVAVLLAVIDAELKRLPDPLTLPSYPAGVALLGLAAPFTEDGGARLLHALLGMAALWLLYAVQWFLVPGQLGFGDVKLAGVLGLYLGWLGPAAALTGVLAIHVTGGLYALGLLITRRAGLRTQIPFGPFMLLGTLIAVLVHA